MTFIFLSPLVHEIQLLTQFWVNDVTTGVKTAIFWERDLRKKLPTSKFHQLLILIFPSPSIHNIKLWGLFTQSEYIDVTEEINIPEYWKLYRIFIYHQMIALQKIRKMFFISPKKLFSFSRYSSFVFLSFPLFLPVSHCFRGWSKKNLKVYDVINCLSKNLITHFVWYLKKEIGFDIETLSIMRVSNKEHFYGKITQKMCTKS